MGNARRGADGQIERGRVREAGPVGVGDRNAARDRQFANLVADAVHEDDLDAERAQHGDVDQNVAKIIVGHDRAVDRDDKNLPLKSGHVF